PVLGFVKLSEGGRCAVTEAPVGRPLMLDDLAAGPDLARSLGQVLARIHTVPRYAAEAAGVESYTPEAMHAAHRARIESVPARRGRPALAGAARGRGAVGHHPAVRARGPLRGEPVHDRRTDQRRPRLVLLEGRRRGLRSRVADLLAGAGAVRRSLRGIPRGA